MSKNPILVLSLIALGAVPRAGSSQEITLQPLPILAGERDDFARLARLAGTDSVRPQTLRAPSRLIPWAAEPSWGSTRWAVGILTPELFVGRNNALAQGFNDGPLWQGRGLNVRVTAGAVGQLGPLRLVLAPQLVTSENAPFQVVPYRRAATPARSTWANPFHPAPASIDLPIRFGDARIAKLVPGQSSVTARFKAVEAGFGTENVWWGPGQTNALLLGAHAPGVPSAFVRTARPLATRTGTWDAWLMVGGLRESAFFDFDVANDTRTLSGLALTWRPPQTDAIELGAGRIVIAARKPFLGAIVAPLQSVGRPNGPDSLSPGDRDQITSLWARWAKPGAGFEAWAEWARFEEPASIRDLLEQPGHSQGYTLGLQWLRPLARSRVRVSAEATYLEPSPSLRLRPVGTTYVSRSVPQGFTHRGEMLGAGIGPGSSGQWLAGDWIHERWRVGGYLSRVRWDNAALFTPVVPHVRREDISLTGGLRAAHELGPVRVFADWAHTARLNYLFQAYLVDPGTGRTEGIDIMNDVITLTVSAPLR